MSNRIHNLMPACNRIQNVLNERELVPAQSGFVAMPLLAFNPDQQRIYQRAFAEAQRVVAPSLPERDLLGVWN